MNVVGITQRCLPPNEFGERRNGLDSRWPSFLAACDVVAVPLPNMVNLALDSARVVGLTGLVLSGGEDLACYGGTSPDRDETERALLGWAMGHRVPVLGVCRGAQMIMDVFGTTLTQVDGHVATRHDVFDGQQHRSVNSYHRYAARSVREPLKAVAVCGGVVESFQHQNADVVGIMWHPEREETFATEDIRLVRRLFGSLQ